MLTTNFSLPSFARAKVDHPKFLGQVQSVTGYTPTLKHGLQADTLSLARNQNISGVKFAGRREDIKHYFQNLPLGTEKTAAEILADMPHVSNTGKNKTGDLIKVHLNPLAVEGFLIKNPDKSYKLSGEQQAE